MIAITITKITETTRTEKQNLLIKKYPTEITEESSGYGSATKRVQFAEEFEVVEVPKRYEITTTLLQQNVADEKFDITAVIKAINGIA